LTGNLQSATGSITTLTDNLQTATSSITANTTSINAATQSLTAATSNSTANTLVLRDANGGFSAGVITGTLSGTSTSSNGLTTARTISTNGDVTYISQAFDGTANVTGAATVNSVGGVNSSTIATISSNVLSATSASTPSTIVKRDGSGNISAGMVTANLTGDVTGNLVGNATTATTATNSTNATSTYKLATARSIYGNDFDGTAAIAGVISPTYGGTGVNNGNKTITLGGNLTTAGGYNTTLTTTNTTNVTLPTSGTLATLTGTETLASKTFSGTTTFNGAVIVSGTNTLTTGGLVAGGTTFPSTTGTTGQVLALNAAGNAVWVTLNEQVDETTTGSVTGNLGAVTAGQTSFTLTQTPKSGMKVKMYINGILISSYAYSVSGLTVTYDATKNGSYSITTGDRIQFIYFY
jgi:hypothetical protein